MNFTKPLLAVLVAINKSHLAVLVVLVAIHKSPLAVCKKASKKPHVKILMKLTPGACAIKLFTAVIYAFS
jgi:hypothetical protein